MNNLFDDRENLKNKIKSWASDVLSEVKSAFGISDTSTVMRDEVGKYFSLGIASGLKENDKHIIKAFKNVLDKLKYERDMDIISEGEYYSELEKLRDKYFAKGTQNWVKYTAEIYKYQKEAVEREKKEITSLYDDVSEYAVDKLNEVIKKQEAFAENLRDVGKIYKKNTVNMGNYTDTFYSMNSFEDDIKNIERYASLLDEFSVKADRLGVSGDIKAGYLSEIKSLDFNASFGVLRDALATTDENFIRYLSAWDTKNKLVESISSNAFAQDFEFGINDAYSHMKDVLQKAGYEIPEGFFVSGSLSAEKFGDAFISEIEEQMSKIRELISDYATQMSASITFPVGNVYNTSNTSYNISSNDGLDTVESIKRYETIKRLSGIL